MAWRITGVYRRPLISLRVIARTLLIDHSRRIWTAFDRLPPSLVGHPRRLAGTVDTRQTGRRLRVAFMLFHLEHRVIHHVPVCYHTSQQNANIFQYRASDPWHWCILLTTIHSTFFYYFSFSVRSLYLLATRRSMKHSPLRSLIAQLWVWVCRFLTAHQHIKGHLVPYDS